jgi:hypothetical protein
MSDREDRALAALDVHFRIQLTAAADTYASSVNIAERLQAIVAVGNDSKRNDMAAPDCRGEP